MSTPNRMALVFEAIPNPLRQVTATALAAVALYGGVRAGQSVIEADPAAANEAIPAETQPTNCDQALEMPTTVHPIRMTQAGIRPFTGWRSPQAVIGSLGYPEINCPGQIRVASGRLQAEKLDEKGRGTGNWYPIWLGSVGSWIGNKEGVSRIIAQPGHADPGYGYLFNDCVNGKFHPIRIKLDLMLKDERTKAVTDKAKYILEPPVKGNCAAARRSKRIAEKQWEENYGIKR